MASGEVVIQSMWSPAITAVKAQGKPCIYQPLKEGYRALAAGFALPKTTKGKQADVVYEFINWYLSGWVGAILTDRDIILLSYQRRNNTCPKMSGAFGWKANPLRRIFLAQVVQSLVLSEKFVTVVHTKIVWAVLQLNATMDENKQAVRKWNEMVAA